MGQSNSRLEKKREAARKKKESRSQNAQTSIRTTRLKKKKLKAGGKHHKKAPDVDFDAGQPAPPPPRREASLSRRASVRYSTSPQPHMQPPAAHPLGLPSSMQTTPYVPPAVSPPLSPPLPQQKQLWLQQQQLQQPPPPSQQPQKVTPATSSHVYSQGMSRTASVVQQQQTSVKQPAALSLGGRRGSTSALADRKPSVSDAKELTQRGTDATTAAAAPSPSASNMRTSSRSNLRRQSSVRLNLEESVVLNDGMVALPNGVTTVTAAAAAAATRATPKLSLATTRTSSILKRRALPSRAQPRREPPTAPTQDIDVIMRQGALPLPHNGAQAGRNGRTDDAAEQQRRRVPSATGAAMTRSLSLSTDSAAMSSYKFALDKDSNDDANSKDKIYMRTTVSAPSSAAVQHAPGTVYCCTTLIVYEMPLRVRGRAAGGGGGANTRGRDNTASPDAEDTSNFAVQTYGDDCTLLKTTVPTTGDVLSYKVHELLAHTSGAALQSSHVTRKAQRMLLAGYSVALLALDAATLTTRSEALQTPSFAAVQLLITDTLAAVQAVRNGTQRGHVNAGRALNDKDSRNARDGGAKSRSAFGARGATLDDDDAAATVVADAQPTSAELYVSIVLLQQPQPPPQRRQSSLSGNESAANAALCVDLLCTGDTDSEGDRVRDSRSGYRSRRSSSVSIIDGYSNRNNGQTAAAAAQAVPKATRLAYSASSMAGLCGAQIHGVHYRRIDDVKTFRMACTDARVNAAAYTESAAHTLPRRGTMQTPQMPASSNNSSGSYGDDNGYGGDGANTPVTPSLYVVTCVLVQSRGEAATLRKLADAQASASADTPIGRAASARNGGGDDEDDDDDDGQRQQQHSCSDDEDDNMLWQPPPPFVVRNARGRAVRAVDDLVISSLTCVCADAAPWLATTLAHDIDSCSSGSDSGSGSGSNRSSPSNGGGGSRSTGSSIAAYLHTLFGSVAHGSVVLGLDPRDVNAYTSLDVQARLAAPLRRRAPRGSLRSCARRLRQSDVASANNVSGSDHSSHSSSSDNSRGRANAACSSRSAVQALVSAVTSDAMVRYLSSSGSNANGN